MPFDVILEPREKLLAEVLYHPSERNVPFCFAVSNRAVFLPSTKLVVSGDPYYMRRVPVGEVTEVKVETARPYGAYLLSAPMIAAGLGVLWFALRPDIAVSPRVFAWGLALGVGGLLLPLAARGRPRLLVRYGKKTYRWTPPMVVDGASKRKVHEVLDRILFACAQAGIHTEDCRAGRKSTLPTIAETGPPAPFAPVEEDRPFAESAPHS